MSQVLNETMSENVTVRNSFSMSDPLLQGTDPGSYKSQNQVSSSDKDLDLAQVIERRDKMN